MKRERTYSSRPVCLLAPAALIAALGLGTASHAFAAQEIDVQGNSTSIVSGDITPDVADDTDFGRVDLGTDEVKTYTILNTGDADLTFGTPPVTGDAGCDAFIIAQPMAADGTTLVTEIAADESTTFTVTYNPTVSGSLDKCEISIANDDADENPYTFVIQASTGPEMDVQGGETPQSITDGTTTTSAAQGTLFAAESTSPLEQTYTILNNGLGDELTLTGTPFVDLVEFADGDGSCEAFKVTTQPTSSTIAVHNGTDPGSAIFKVTYTPPASENGTPCTVSIANDDADENPYDFAIQVALPEIDVQGGADSVSIVDGDDTPDVADGTDLGGFPVSNTAEPTVFTIKNIGGAALTLGAAPAVTLGPDCGTDLFEITTQPTSPIAAGGEATFTVKYKQTVAEKVDKCTIKIASDDKDEAAYDFLIQASTGPEMDVTGNSNDIDDGATTTSVDNATRFAAASESEKTYTIENNGGAALNLTAEDSDPLVALSGEGCGGFEVTTQPEKKQIAVAENTTFKVKYTPPTDDAKKTGAPCTVSIANDDGNENPYDFVIQAELPEIDVQGGADSVSIADGDTTPSEADDTSFGEVAVGESMTKTYTILNIGGADLNLTAEDPAPLVALTGDGCDDGQFTVTQPEAKTLVAAPAAAPDVSSTTFKVTYTPTSIEKKQCTVSITNDDSDENPYDFVIQSGKSGGGHLPAVYQILLNSN